MRQLGELVYEHGKRYLDEPLPRGAHSHENIGPEVLFRHNPAQSFYNVPPHPDRIVVLLVEGDPGEGQASFYCSMPLGQERRLSVSRRGAYEGYLAVEGFPQELEQPGANQLLGARCRRPQLGLDDDAGRIEVWVAGGVDDCLPCPVPLFRAAHTHHTAACIACCDAPCRPDKIPIRPTR